MAGWYSASKDEEVSMSQQERMAKGLLYNPQLDGLVQEEMRAKVLAYQYNACCPDDLEKRRELLCELLGSGGENAWIEQPFYCNYGSHITVGRNFYANYHCTILDVAQVTIGDNVMFGPNVSLYTASHPLHPDNRNSGWEYGISITIGNNVWLGGNVVVNPGVHIGDNVVVGSGSVVTKDLPDNVFAAGNPARVIRAITDEDKKYYYKDRPFETGTD